MGYRTNQCQQCGQYGHNRRGCPQIKEAHARVEKLAEKYGVYRSEDELAYASTQWIGRINEAAQIQDADEDEISWRDRWHWEEIETRKIAQAQKNARGRQCGFCNERGHNARTCPEKKQHKVVCNQISALAHRIVKSQLEKAGLLPGALVQWETWSGSKELAMVTHIDWDSVCKHELDHSQGVDNRIENWIHSRNRFIKVSKLGAEANNAYGSGIALPANILQQSNYRYGGEDHRGLNLISPIFNATVNHSHGYRGDSIERIGADDFSLFFGGERIMDEEWGKEMVALAAEVGVSIHGL